MRSAAGIGLRSPHVAQVGRERPAAGFLEIHAENYLAPWALQNATRLRDDYEFSVHAVGLSLGSADGLDEGHLGRVAALVRRLEPALVSDHLAWSMNGSLYFNDLLPLPYTEEALEVVVRNVQCIQETFGRQIAIENPSCYLRFAHSTLSEPEFLGELSRRSGCGLLLDVNNIVVTAHNLRLDPAEWIAQLSGDAIVEYHLAGHAANDCDGETILIDDHGSRVSEAVWVLFGDVVRRFGARPCIVEWDTEIPALSVLLDEREHAERVMQAAAGFGDAARAA